MQIKLANLIRRIKTFIKVIRTQDLNQESEAMKLMESRWLRHLRENSRQVGKRAKDIGGLDQGAKSEKCW